MSDFAIKSSSSEINICVLPSCFLKGRPRDAGPLPDNTRNEDDLKNKEDLKNEDNLKNKDHTRNEDDLKNENDLQTGDM